MPERIQRSRRSEKLPAGEHAEVRAMSVVIPNHRCDPCPVYLSASAPKAKVMAAWLRRYEARMTGYAVGLHGEPLVQWARQGILFGDAS